MNNISIWRQIYTAISALFIVQGRFFPLASRAHFERTYYFNLLVKKGLRTDQSDNNRLFKSIPFWRRSSSLSSLYIILFLLLFIFGITPVTDIRIGLEIDLTYSFAYLLFCLVIGIYSIKPRIIGLVSTPDCQRDVQLDCALVGREGLLDLSYWELFFLTHVSLVTTLIFFKNVAGSLFPIATTLFLTGLTLYFKEIKRGFRCPKCTLAQLLLGTTSLVSLTYFSFPIDIHVFSKTLCIFILVYSFWIVVVQSIKTIYVVLTTPEFLTNTRNVKNQLFSNRQYNTDIIENDLTNWNTEQNGTTADVVFILSLADKSSLLCLKFLTSIQGRYLLSENKVAIRMLLDRSLIIANSDIDAWDLLQEVPFNPNDIYERYSEVSTVVMSSRRLSSLGSTNLVDPRDADIWVKNNNLPSEAFILYERTLLEPTGVALDYATLTSLVFLCAAEKKKKSSN